MSKKAVIIKNWPFEKGERVKLIWIGEPFKQNNKWMVYSYFKRVKATKKIILDWASIHFLSIEKYYTDGNLNNSEDLENFDIIDINLNNIVPQYIEKDWKVWRDGFSENTKSKTFNFLKDGILYTIPIIEVIRAVLAPDKFWLNRILEMDALENYFTYEIKERVLDIYFTSEYDSKLLKSEKINHLAWILSNDLVLRMFNSIGKSIWQSGELKYDFLLNRFNIRARVKRNNSNSITVLEIISFYRKRIKVEEINIYHPSLEESVTSNTPKRRKYVGIKGKDDIELDTDSDGSTKDSEEIDTFMLNHEYEMLPKINKKKTGRRIVRTGENENTKTYVIDKGNSRTTADYGGEKLLRGLEFNNLERVQAIGELKEFVEILKLLRKRHTISKVEIIINELPEGIFGKRFSRLNDGVTRRKYAIGKITMVDGNECSLIEVEREDKALSMLLLKSEYKIKWEPICNKLLLQLVEDSGKWSNDKIEKIKLEGIELHRIKHINKSVFDKENHIYNKLSY